MELTLKIQESTAQIQTPDQKLTIQFLPIFEAVQADVVQLYTDKKGKWHLMTEALPEEMHRCLAI
ncbi:hypothetical protein CIRMBP1230_01527 [Enterococcus cecorum]|nr:hypothetical protein [Enterococcus cecorum]MDT2796995.1 hypothetical protein [Enterococcus cecorum]MDZ5573427.1 hypothetical protein [Enterococcus cecorum]CAI3296108.1 hypothetical protein CIRMBP1233_00631 [Enterococcus cecorum]CAI3313358.1 hypothetical protein CIRMBP1216_00825 [Enterococcus cecorum]CAI3347107.1 hypothetical protein CIRMBP1251_00987 [Enterococcus cecorum]